MRIARVFAAVLAASSCALGTSAFSQNIVEATASTQTIQIEAGTGRLLRFPRDAESVFVGNPAIAAIQPVSGTLAYVSGTRTGVTDVFAIDEGESLIGSYRVIVRESAAAARAVTPNVAPGARIDFAGRLPIIEGEVGDIGGAMEAEVLRRALAADNGGAIDRTDFTGPTQVNLRVRFVEVRRNDVNNLGINFSALTDIGNFTLGLATGTAVVGGAVVADPLSGASASFGRFGAGFATGSTSVQSLIDALAQTGAAEVLAEPTLTTVSGREATFLAGGEFPIVVPQDSGVFTTEFKEFGVSLGFLPTLLPNNRIALAVTPEVSALDFTSGIELGGVAVPGLTTRRISTTVELGSGQTFAIGGLFQREINDTVSGVPGVKDVPVLGKLFSSRRFRQNETELLVVVTPYLVGSGGDTAPDGGPPPAEPKLAGFLYSLPGGQP